ncbi:MAG: 2-C-methyl-D-erythritol 2,4-cyclodiphosphate synthase [Gemmatales bacterium]|nr:2-C-methyl-D-erythritol 2,4-cyclodiphosphate synthase [Gemmatales bacterium]MCS7161104.1 2-C-methyl-D-erythritol 2,4-cyclodiphosphate synthase [Gemmatales bacterium]MDW8176307.1 2-C-methyl-D-erythritol 2,4-cyclodiphosphate synthase [Gemmatales bacterium]MDW8221752.1 2-C-methyl-D-erythritol 2,4-cyclodiphosphate synthase [Gemmatales bacterium]
MRVGLGYDSHRLEPGRPLRLGGLEIAAMVGAVGHSDADVVLHALVDALLGAAGLGDIGDWFPDSEPRWRGADSTIFLRETLNRVAAKGFHVRQADIIIVAESPRLGPDKERIRQRLAELLALPTDCVNVKAKTNEGLDAIGRGQAIACYALVALAEPGEHHATQV